MHKQHLRRAPHVTRRNLPSGERKPISRRTASLETISPNGCAPSSVLRSVSVCGSSFVVVGVRVLAECICSRRDEHSGRIRSSSGIPLVSQHCVFHKLSAKPIARDDVKKADRATRSSARSILRNNNCAFPAVKSRKIGDARGMTLSSSLPTMAPEDGRWRKARKAMIDVSYVDFGGCNRPRGGGLAPDDKRCEADCG